MTPLEETKAPNAQTTVGDAETSPLTRPKVFLSYGRKDARVLVDRLCMDIVAEGFDVWRDTEEIRSGDDWQEEIADGLRSAQVVVAVLTPHSVRTSARGQNEVDSVCLGEIAYALFRTPPRPVVPVMAATCEPPLALFHLDYVDLRAWSDSEDQYRAGFARLVEGIRAALRGEKRYRAWFHELQAFDFAPFLFSRRQHFVGRQWLFDAIDAWRADPGAKPVLLVRGDAGVGKSAIVADLVHRNPDGQVLAYHCCQWNLPATLDSRRFVQSLASMISSKSEAFAERLRRDETIRRKLMGEESIDPKTLFYEALLAPLHSLPAPAMGRRYLLIDALDETLLAPPGTPTIVEVLAAHLDRLPAWLRVVATTRNEPQVLSRLRGLKPAELNAHSPENLADLQDYLQLRLARPNLQERLTQEGRTAEEVAQLLFASSEGNFLHARQTLDDFETGVLTGQQLAALPPGLAGLYENRFAAQFPDEASFAGPERVFEVLAAAQEPLNEAQLAAASGLEPLKELPRLLARLQQYLRTVESDEGRRITFYHKSLSDWLTHADRRGLHRSIEPRLGHRHLARAGWSEFQRGVSDLSPYFLRYLPAHLIAAEQWDNLEQLLTDLSYYEARNAAGQLTLLVTDISSALNALPVGRPERKLIQLLEESLRLANQLSTTNKAGYPQGVFQCIWNAGCWHDSPRLKPQILERREDHKRWGTRWCRRADVTNRGHSSGPILAVASNRLFSQVVSVGNSDVLVWDPVSSQVVSRVTDFSPAASSVAISRNQSIVIGHIDGSVSVWGASLTRKMASFVLGDSAIVAVDAAPIEERFAAVNSQGEVFLLALPAQDVSPEVTQIQAPFRAAQLLTGQPLGYEFCTDEHGPWSVNYSADGSLLVVRNCRSAEATQRIHEQMGDAWQAGFFWIDMPDRTSWLIDAKSGEILKTYPHGEYGRANVDDFPKVSFSHVTETMRGFGCSNSNKLVPLDGRVAKSTSDHGDWLLPGNGILSDPEGKHWAVVNVDRVDFYVLES
ncbi:MAG: TIR domain-containing protein [Pirellulaceae bacterium]|nr:TIR domain-containing protein [Pirellulaceae bacterium]